MNKKKKGKLAARGGENNRAIAMRRNYTSDEWHNKIITARETDRACILHIYLYRYYTRTHTHGKILSLKPLHRGKRERREGKKERERERNFVSREKRRRRENKERRERERGGRKGGRIINEVANERESARE